ncbi:TatD family hydrolase [Polycladomyces subterraneus]|uniref:TatD family hydrolase n=1 Tax=Polycladomyces subterraneus TaxID=1016997 RepID=A0ABT8IP87_9BACL|nr:TatD family hydrolase [Polycladomyces subterraneus]MDN4594596.1 TatD family hydrolase [Polycladomyces subterraneus]
MEKGMSLVDTHVHFDQFPEEEVPEIIERARQAGVNHVVAVASGADSCLRLLEWKRRLPDWFTVAFGVHPERKTDDAEVETVIELIRRHREEIGAIGEVGLPYYTLPEMRRKQPPSPDAVARLSRFLLLAAELDLPVVLHAVHETAEPVRQLLRRHGVKQAVFHWLKAPADVLRHIVDDGYLISVTPDVLHRERDRELARQVPLSQLLLETDAPWEYEGKRAEPARVKEVAEEVARVKGVTFRQVCQQTTENARRLFSIDTSMATGW